jgi:hypothetical protein
MAATMKLSTLVKRQPRRGTLLYGVCLFFYMLYATAFAATLIPPGANLARFWPIIIPAVILTSQLVYPTLLGWVCVIVGFGSFTCVYAYCLLLWQGSISEFAIGLVILTALASICVGLLRLVLCDH